jgi:hypothetical protein
MILLIFEFEYSRQMFLVWFVATWVEIFSKKDHSTFDERLCFHLNFKLALDDKH